SSRRRHTRSKRDWSSDVCSSDLSVKSSDMWMTLIVGGIVLVVVIMFYKELLISSFDPTMSAAYGLPNRLIHYTLMVLLTMVTVASLQTVGVILVVAMLITPASTAYLLTNRLSVMIVLASLFGAVSSVIGLYFSFVYNLSSGAVIVLVTTLLFILAFILAPRQGVLWRFIRTQKNKTAME